MHSGAIDSFKATNPLMDGEHYNALQHNLKMSIEQLKHVCIAPPVLFNPDGTSNHAVCHDRERPDEKPSRFGLKRMGVDFTKYPDLPKEQYGDLFKNDIYYAPDVGKELQTVISCDAEEVDVNARKSNPISPQCQHFFIFKPLNANVSIGYRRVYLEDWRAIQAAWEKLLQSLIVERQTNPASTTGRK